MAFYNNHQLFIFSKGSIVFIVIATSEANAGMILNLKSYLEPLVSEIEKSNINISYNNNADQSQSTVQSLAGSMTNVSSYGDLPNPSQYGGGGMSSYRK